MSELFNLKRDLKFKHDIKKDDFLKLRPTTSSADNKNLSGEILFQVAQASSCLDICESILFFSIELKDLEADEEITLEHNFFPKLFSQMRLNLGGIDIEIINTPGDISSLLNFVLFNQNIKDTYGELMGWIPDNKKGDTDNSGFKIRKELYNEKKVFTGYFPLKQLFGFLQCYNRIIYLLSIDLSVTRNANNDKEIFYGKEKVVGTSSKAKLVLKDIELWIPQYRLNPELEVDVMKQMKSIEKIDVSYLKRIPNVLDIPEGSNFTWTPSNLSSKPRFLIMGFKNADIQYTENNSKFIQASGDKRITSLQVELKNVFYPITPMMFDVNKYNNVLPYSYYVSMCNVFGNEPQLNLRDFMNLYSIFCFDFTAQDNEETSGYQVTIHIQKDTTFKAKCYCVILEEKKSTIYIQEGKMLNVV